MFHYFKAISKNKNYTWLFSLSDTFILKNNKTQSSVAIRENNLVKNLKDFVRLPEDNKKLMWNDTTDGMRKKKYI